MGTKYFSLDYLILGIDKEMNGSGFLPDDCNAISDPKNERMFWRLLFCKAQISYEKSHLDLKCYSNDH